MPTLTIDGRQITVEKGTTILRAAKRLGIEIPYYCYHPGLSIAGNCRMCLVEVEKFPKLQIACHIQAQDGMAVRTETEGVQKTRRHVLEFLLINHPLDCPVCDQAGECWLQDYYMKFGLYDSRFDENKVKKHKAVSLGPTVMLDSERCILCSRCVRFTDEVSKTSELGIFDRGDRAEIGLYPGRGLANKYSGNVVDICPVGALTDKDFRFKCRVWYLESSPSVCPGCSMGCNTAIHYQLERPHIAGGDRVMRIKPRENPEVNKWWICDEGRYGYAFIDKNRILHPALGAGKNRAPVLWDGALDFAAEKLRSISPNHWAIVLSPQLTNEELYLAKKIFAGGCGYPVYLISPFREGWSDDFLIRADKNPNTRGAFEVGLPVQAGQLEALVARAGDGSLRGLYLFGQDLLEFLKPETADRLFGATEVLIFEGSNWNRSAERAHLVLPSATYAEKEGTFTNCLRRVQRIFKAFEPKGESRADWEILIDLAARLGVPVPGGEPRKIFAALGEGFPAFAGLSYGSLGRQGAVLS